MVAIDDALAVHLDGRSNFPREEAVHAPLHERDRYRALMLPHAEGSTSHGVPNHFRCHVPASGDERPMARRDGAARDGSL